MSNNINKFLSYEGLSYYDSKLKAYIKDEELLEEGLSEGSIQTTTGNNIAGCKGFYWTDIDVTNKSITLEGNKVKTLSGTWKFNENQSLSNQVSIIQTINFTSNGEKFEYISRSYTVFTSGNTILTNDQLTYGPEDGSMSIGAWQPNTWTDEAYRTVDFGTEPQEVSEDFYTWFIANAVKQ